MTKFKRTHFEYYFTSSVLEEFSLTAVCNHWLNLIKRAAIGESIYQLSQFPKFVSKNYQNFTIQNEHAMLSHRLRILWVSNFSQLNKFQT